MEKILLVLIIVVGLKCTLLLKAPTPNVYERLALLKLQISQDIKNKQHSFVPPENDVDPMEIKTTRSGPITPISRARRKKKTKTSPVTVTDETSAKESTTDNVDKTSIDNTTDDELEYVDPNVQAENATNDKVVNTIPTTASVSVQPLRMIQIEASAKKWAKHVKSNMNGDIFARRQYKSVYTDEPEVKKKHALLCVDLLRPILSGLKKNVTQNKVLGDHIANRLIQLLSFGGNGQNVEDIESVLYQINALQLRFFQWDVSAIKKLFNFIMPGQKHSFKSMKYGIKRIFQMWNMDLSNTNILIKDSRMFRPPCVGTSEGSTRSSAAIRYTKPATPKSTCAPKDKLCQKKNDNSQEDSTDVE